MDAKKLLKNLTQGRNAVLTPHIDSYLEGGGFPSVWDIQIRNYKPHDKFFHPSSDCLADVDKLYVDKTKTVPLEKISANLRRTFDNGHMWHGYLQEILVEMGFIKREGVECEHVKYLDTFFGSAIAKGTGDLVGVQIPGQGDWLVDIKTMNHASFQVPDEYMMKKYIAQVNVYGDWFNLEKMMILAVDKNTSELREFIVTPDPNLVQSIYNRWGFVQDCVSRQIAPWARTDIDEEAALLLFPTQ